jgi:3-phosphoshikimate 1-carboxyvinyltransferase
MAGLLAAAPFDSLLVGDASLSSRPMARVIEPLSEMGARIEQVAGGLQIYGSQQLRGIRYRMPVASAQVKSAVLIAALHSGGITEVIEPVPTRDHTERLLEYLGVKVGFARGPSGESCITADSGSRLGARDVSVPGDISSAAYFIAAAAMLPASTLTLRAVGLNPTRTQFIRLLQKAGVDIGISSISISYEPRGDLNITQSTQLRLLEPFVIDGADVVGLIDELPILAVLSTRLAGMRLRGASELRAKESDRITSVVENLTRMGARLEECADGFDISPSRLKGAELDAFGDHRIAMAFAIAALAAEDSSHIRGAEACDVSFPGFFGALDSLAVR